MTCKEDFELKSSAKRFGKKITDGEYKTMIERLRSNSNPNLFLLHYNSIDWEVQNLTVIPKQYFTPAIIEKRPPLSSNAKRSGWTGCNILIADIPSSGKIPIIENQQILHIDNIQHNWQRNSFLRIRIDMDFEAKGWLLTIMTAVESLNKKIFSLQELYAMESEIKKAYPGNNHIKDKIRQQLQILRNFKYLNFLGNGIYELTN